MNDKLSIQLRHLQREAKDWQTKNFKKQKPYQPLLGIVEEVGELAHAHLKQEQGIRKGEDFLGQKVDAIGDVIVFLAHYCNLSGIDLENAVYYTWQEVKQRDWIRFPFNGRTK